MNIIICGLPASGKTTVGRMLADSLGWNFLDTDWLIEKAYLAKTGHLYTCRQICTSEDELFFRALEKQQIYELLNLHQTIISVGGGSLTDPENKKILQSLGSILYLKMTPGIIWERLKIRGIPSYLNPHDPETEFHALAEFRMSLFESIANEIIEAEMLAPHEILARILNDLHTQSLS